MHSGAPSAEDTQRHWQFSANLSENYFTTRQDRALLVENSPVLVEFFSSLFDLIASVSLKLKEDGEMSFQGEPKMDPLSGVSDLRLHNPTPFTALFLPRRF